MIFLPICCSKEDDLTERLKKIIKANEYLLKLTEEEDIDPSKLQV